jgi:hypothetical protein
MIFSIALLFMASQPKPQMVSVGYMITPPLVSAELA